MPALSVISGASAAGGGEGAGSENTATGEEGDFELLLAALDQINRQLQTPVQDSHFLNNVLQSQNFRSLVKVHCSLSENWQHLSPTNLTAYELASEIQAGLGINPAEHQARELCQLLEKPHFKALLDAHDQVASKNFVAGFDLPPSPCSSTLPPSPTAADNPVKIIRLVKASNEPLGATIKRDEESGEIMIARVMHGGAADRSGLIHNGDQLHQVNGIAVKEKSPLEVVKLLTAINGMITFKLVPADMDKRQNRRAEVRVRAHFDYSPLEDLGIPCREAGLPFKRGDVLCIVNQADLEWWQARKETGKPHEPLKVGLVPSIRRQERCEAPPSNGSHDSVAKSNGINGSSPLMKNRKSKAKKFTLHSKMNETQDPYYSPYEEVVKYQPPPGRFRPIILIGAPGVGRNELKRRLIASNSNMFATTVPHTTRPRKPTEVEGKDYFFTTRPDMEKEIHSGKFLESGEYKGNLYGTSLQAISSLISQGKVCILCIQPQALKLVQNGEFKPHVIFVKTPPIDRLLATRLPGSPGHSSLVNRSTPSRVFTEEDLNLMLVNSSRMEHLYGHCFDQVIVNDELQLAYNQLWGNAYQVQEEPQWVPANWLL